MSARRARQGLVALVISTALLLAPSAARASPLPGAGPLEVSHDGVTFAADADDMLFDDIDRVVPGDRLTESLWARSSASTVGRLGIELTDVVADDRALARAISIDLRVNAVPVGSVALGDATTACLVIDDSTLLRPGEVARVDAELSVSAALGDASLPGGQDGTVAFGVRVTLTDAVMPERGPGPCRPVPAPTTGTGELPATGAPSLAALGFLLFLALGATVAGGAALHERRRR